MREKNIVPIEKQIQNLRLPVSARTKMCALHQMAKSVGAGNGYLMPNLFVTGDGKEADLLGKLYATIFDEYRLYSMRGDKNYLMLTYPVDGTVVLYERFFSSADIVATTTNKFYGVMTIDLSEWKNVYDISEDKDFARLLEYVELNKNNMTFIFSVNSTFQGKDELILALKKKLNLEVFEQLTFCDEESVDFIVEEINNAGLDVTKGARALIESNIDEGLNHESLELIVQRILLHCKSMPASDESIGARVDVAFMKQVSGNVFEGIKEASVKKIIGFVK